jgi:hypothetical protein
MQSQEAPIWNAALPVQQSPCPTNFLSALAFNHTAQSHVELPVFWGVSPCCCSKSIHDYSSALNMKRDVPPKCWSISFWLHDVICQRQQSWNLSLHNINQFESDAMHPTYLCTSHNERNNYYDDDDDNNNNNNNNNINSWRTNYLPQDRQCTRRYNVTRWRVRVMLRPHRLT